jgi:hypothetical protein
MEDGMRWCLPGMVVAFMLSMTLCASAQDVLRLAQAPMPEAAPAEQKLAGMAAWNALVGNSITGKEDGETLVEYYASDGTAKSMLGNEITNGKWALVGEAICFQYPDQEMECYKIEVMGNTATFTDQKGTGTRYEILKGNPKGL